MHHDLLYRCQWQRFGEGTGDQARNKKASIVAQRVLLFPKQEYTEPMQRTFGRKNEIYFIPLEVDATITRVTRVKRWGTGLASIMALCSMLCDKKETALAPTSQILQSQYVPHKTENTISLSENAICFSASPPPREKIHVCKCAGGEKKQITRFSTWCVPHMS